MIRAKFEVTKVAELGDYNGKRQEVTAPVLDDSGKAYEWRSTGVPIREITMSAVCSDADPENASFAKNTPTGTLTFLLNNPDLADAFKPGERYYLGFTKA